MCKSKNTFSRIEWIEGIKKKKVVNLVYSG